MHKVGKKDYHYIRMHGQQNIKKLKKVYSYTYTPHLGLHSMLLGGLYVLSVCVKKQETFRRHVMFFVTSLDVNKKLGGLPHAETTIRQKELIFVAPLQMY